MITSGDLALVASNPGEVTMDPNWQGRINNAIQTNNLIPIAGGLHVTALNAPPATNVTVAITNNGSATTRAWGAGQP